MEQRISLITLGVTDLARSRYFYEHGLGWQPSSASNEQVETIASIPGLGMAPVGHLSYSADSNMRVRRIPPCSVRGRIDPITPKG